MKCEKLFEELSLLEEKYLSVLEDICNIESPTSNKEGVDKVGEYLLKIGEELEFNTEVFKHDISGNVVIVSMNDNSKEKPLCVSGHIDTVHPIGLFGYPPTKKDEKNMYGPGVMDCKGGVVAALMAMEALKNVGFTSRPIKLLIQSDEENGSSSSNKATINFICQKSKDAIAFLNLEGHVKDTAVVFRKGILRYKICINGVAVHSASCASGSNAVLEAAYKIIELEKMKDTKGLTCNCGVISGGTVPNTVAASCEFYADIRFGTTQELEYARNLIEKIVNTVYVDGCKSTYQEVSFRPAMEKTDRNYNLLEEINLIYSENEMPILTARECMSGSDAANITQKGIPCLDNLGTEGMYIHSIKEYMELDSLLRSAKRIAAVAYCI